MRNPGLPPIPREFPARHVVGGALGKWRNACIRGAHGHHHRPRRRCKKEDARSFPRDKATLGHQGVATTRLGGELGQRWLLQASSSSTAASPFPKIPALLAEGPSARVTRSPSSPRPLAAH
ncbi:hypothetical protein TcCL_Unassigned00867 [Trypanosoma cruzi]|nr:hypothetical protein TcCL_Unassigned00867 [Trypanosoma cruzi]